MVDRPLIDVETDSDLNVVKYPKIQNIFIAKTVKMNKDIFLIYVIRLNLIFIKFCPKMNKKDNIVNIRNISIGTKKKEYEISSNKKLKSTVQMKNILVSLEDSITLESTKISNGNREYMYIAG